MLSVKYHGVHFTNFYALKKWAERHPEPDFSLEDLCISESIMEIRGEVFLATGDFTLVRDAQSLSDYIRDKYGSWNRTYMGTADHLLAGALVGHNGKYHTERDGIVYTMLWNS